MQTAVDAIYEHGHLRLLHPLPLPENTPVRVAIELPEADPERRAWLEQSEQRLRAVWTTRRTMFTMSCSRGDVVLLPIPFTDLTSTKVRPAVVVGLGTFPGDVFVVPVTSQLQNADLVLTDWHAAGLNVLSGIKGQLCTVEERLVRKRVGRISAADQACLDRALRTWLGL